MITSLIKISSLVRRLRRQLRHRLRLNLSQIFIIIIIDIMMMLANQPELKSLIRLITYNT